MAAVNEANRVLSDPELRAHYDATGQSAPPPPIEVEAENALMAMFAQASEVAEGDYLKVIRRNIELSRSNASSELLKGADLVKKLTKRRDAITVEGEGRNLAAMVIQQRLDQLARQIATVERGREVLDRVAELFEAYSSTEPAHIKTGGFAFFTSSATT